MTKRSRHRFHKRLKEARQNIKLPQDRAAQQVGLSSRQAWSYYECRGLPDIDLCAKMAAVLCVKPEWLAGWAVNVAGVKV